MLHCVRPYPPNNGVDPPPGYAKFHTFFRPSLINLQYFQKNGVILTPEYKELVKDTRYIRFINGEKYHLTCGASTFSNTNKVQSYDVECKDGKLEGLPILPKPKVLKCNGFNQKIQQSSETG